MKLNLPKSNIQWSINVADPTRNPWESPCSVNEIVAAFTLPSGEVLKNAVRLDAYHAKDSAYLDHMVDRVVAGIEREVGRRMVRGR